MIPPPPPKKAAFANVCSTVQAKLSKMQDSWLNKKADEIQSYTDRHDSKRYFDAVKALYSPLSTKTSFLLSVDDTTLITEKEKISGQMCWEFWIHAEQTIYYKWQSNQLP